jgi:hypothetical protein
MVSSRLRSQMNSIDSLPYRKGICSAERTECRLLPEKSRGCDADGRRRNQGLRLRGRPRGADMMGLQSDTCVCVARFRGFGAEVGGTGGPCHFETPLPTESYGVSCQKSGWRNWVCTTWQPSQTNAGAAQHGFTDRLVLGSDCVHFLPKPGPAWLIPCQISLSPTDQSGWTGRYCANDERLEVESCAGR